MARETNNGNSTTNNRTWHRGDRSKVSIMHVFRSAHYKKDAKTAHGKAATGETEISQRSKQRREGLDETTLKADLQADLSALMNTIQLDSAESLSDAPHVQRSVLNYGFRDLSDISPQDMTSADVVNSIRQSLLDHEPRIIPETLEVKVADSENNSRFRLEITVSAELMGDPVDVPVDFDAEVDLGAGKLRMQNLRIQS